MTKIITGAAIGYLAIWPVHCSAAPASGSQICILRPGENGSLNTIPVTIQIPPLAELTITGEEEVCLRVIPASRDWKQAIRLRFAKPYDPRQPRFWTTSPVFVSIKLNSTTRVLLCPRIQKRNAADWEKIGWQRIWVLSPPESHSACFREYRK